MIRALLKNRVRTERCISENFQIQRNMIVVTGFLRILNELKFRLIHNQKENRHYDHIPFNLKAIVTLFL